MEYLPNEDLFFLYDGIRPAKVARERMMVVNYDELW
jgi:hypothetical protein